MKAAAALGLDGLERLIAASGGPVYGAAEASDVDLDYEIAGVPGGHVVVGLAPSGDVTVVGWTLSGVELYRVRFTGAPPAALVARAVVDACNLAAHRSPAPAGVSS